MSNSPSRKQLEIRARKDIVNRVISNSKTINVDEFIIDVYPGSICYTKKDEELGRISLEALESEKNEKSIEQIAKRESVTIWFSGENDHVMESGKLTLNGFDEGKKVVDILNCQSIAFLGSKVT